MGKFKQYDRVQRVAGSRKGVINFVYGAGDRVKLQYPFPYAANGKEGKVTEVTATGLVGVDWDAGNNSHEHAGNIRLVSKAPVASTQTLAPEPPQAEPATSGSGFTQPQAPAEPLATFAAATIEPAVPAAPAMKAAADALAKVARSKPFFTADDVWAEVQDADIGSADRRLLGSLLVEAQKAGHVKSTDRTEHSKRRRSYTRVWQSLIAQAQA